jgi:hypothetical protein
VPSQASGRGLRLGSRPGRRASVAVVVASYAPIFEGHCCAISAFAAVCWPLLANFTFA